MENDSVLIVKGKYNVTLRLRYDKMAEIQNFLSKSVCRCLILLNLTYTSDAQAKVSNNAPYYHRNNRIAHNTTTAIATT